MTNPSLPKSVFMTALWNMAGHYIFALWFLIIMIIMFVY